MCIIELNQANSNKECQGTDWLVVLVYSISSASLAVHLVDLML